mmetsp:Transcript_152044/g.276491  ORF Transcript_152044/g.276491 Transcript_152044/m.276491 type:complete len:200 (+) Transcript_152044:73-672(+)
MACGNLLMGLDCTAMPLACAVILGDTSKDTPVDTPAADVPDAVAAGRAGLVKTDTIAGVDCPDVLNDGGVSLTLGLRICCAACWLYSSAITLNAAVSASLGESGPLGLELSPSCPRAADPSGGAPDATAAASAAAVRGVAVEGIAIPALPLLSSDVRPHFNDQMSASISRISSFCLSIKRASMTSAGSGAAPHRFDEAS